MTQKSYLRTSNNRTYRLKNNSRKQNYKNLPKVLIPKIKCRPQSQKTDLYTKKPLSLLAFSQESLDDCSNSGTGFRDAT